MKTFIDSMLALICYQVSASEKKTIETESIAIKDFISFILEKYPVVTDSILTRNITFLIQTYDNNFNDEERLLLKQAFKLISDRLTEKDAIRVISYEKYNGVVLDWTSPKQSKKILHAIAYPVPSTDFLGANVIEFAYNNTRQQFINDSKNSIVKINLLNTEVVVENEEPLVYMSRHATPAPAGIVF
ncbi:MAG: hypothetical protein AAFX55_08275 [Bacteroidota bacterium]